MENLRIKIGLVFALVLSACTAAPTPTLAPSTTPMRLIPTFAATPVPSVTVTPSPMPTPFVTAPTAGQVAIVPILMYHHLADLPAKATELEQTWTVAPKNFEAQMTWLAQHGYHTITMAQLVAHLKRQQPLPVKSVIISFDDGWAEQYVVAFPALKRNGFIGTFFVYTNPLDHNSYLSWAQLIEMSGAGMDIQAHSLTHPHLRTLAADAALKEISESKQILEKRLNKPVIAFDYPFGEYDAAVIDLVKRAGFESAVSLAAGYKQRADELFVLHRIRVSYLDTLDEFAKRLP